MSNTDVGHVDGQGRYMFDQAWQQEHARLTALENIWDPFTFGYLESLAPLGGARCLEVGAGAGSVASWLCERAGPDGHVVATDLDTRFVMGVDAPNLEVRTHDIVNDDIEEGTYDLVHTRLLLSHLPAHRTALGRMVAALKPGGWLLVEEFDHVSFLPDAESDAADQAIWARAMEAFALLSAHRGLDLPYGRRLQSLFDEQGLSEVHAEGRVTMERGGTPGRDLLLLSIRSLRETLIGTGAIDAAGVDRMIELLEDPAFAWMSQIMVTARGRKPLS